MNDNERIAHEVLAYEQDQARREARDEQKSSCCVLALMLLSAGGLCTWIIIQAGMWLLFPG